MAEASVRDGIAHGSLGSKSAGGLWSYRPENCSGLIKIADFSDNSGCLRVRGASSLSGL